MQSVRTPGDPFVFEIKLTQIVSLKCRLLLCVFCSFALGSVSFAQQSATIRNSTALTFLSQAVSAAGGTSALSAVQDFTAQGSITHYWQDNPEQGQLTVKSRGLSQFRIDSILPEGTWSFIADGGNGEEVYPDATTNPVAYQNLLNAGSMTWPIIKINAALTDETTTIIDVGLVQLGGRQARQIRIQQNSARTFSNLTKTDYFFDPSSFLILRVQDTAHPDHDAVNGSTRHTIDFSNYRNVSGLLVAFSINQSVGGQQVWSIRLSSVAFNSGLSEADFQF